MIFRHVKLKIMYFFSSWKLYFNPCEPTPTILVIKISNKLLVTLLLICMKKFCPVIRFRYIVWSDYSQFPPTKDVYLQNEASMDEPGPLDDGEKTPGELDEAVVIENLQDAHDRATEDGQDEENVDVLLQIRLKSHSKAEENAFNEEGEAENEALNAFGQNGVAAIVHQNVHQAR